MWQAKPFGELTTSELHAIFKLRTEIFVVAQTRVYQEVDDDDLRAIHVFKKENDTILAYARIFETEDGYVTIGRVVTNPNFRGQGLGGELMKEVMATIKKHYGDLPIRIYAQEQVETYYHKFGFETQGDAFTYHSTPHFLMIHAPLNEEA